MHGLSPQQIAEMVSSFLVPYYVALAAMNGIAALLMWQKFGSKTLFELKLPAFTFRLTNSLLWTIVALGYMVLASMSAGANMSMIPKMPLAFREYVNAHTGPVIYSVGTTAVLLVLFAFRSWFVRPAIAWTIWNLMLLFLGLSMPDENFYAIVAKPDNVPIVALVFLLAFFTWLGTYRAVQNDERIAKGEPPLEKLDDEKVLVWPDLVYTEMICMIALSALLIFWAMWLQAPLEEPANVAKTPNPSKAPWYFLGLQEMLVYYDPWMAGVVLPSLIIVGLMAIPYIDFKKEGNGYYKINQRKFAYIMFQYGFLVLWVILILLGTFLRGPNWNFFGPYEFWDLHKIIPLNNVNLSDIFWVQLFGTSKPTNILVREIPGILLVLAYLTLVPLALTRLSFFKKVIAQGGWL